MPIAFGLLNGGAPFGPVLSFIVASPLLNPLIIVMIAAFMGIKTALIYFAVTFSSAVIFGAVFSKGCGKYIKKLDRAETKEKDKYIPSSIKDKIREAFYTSWGSFRGIIPYIIAGAAIGAVINGYVPQETVADIGGEQNLWAVPVSAVIGIPLYIRVESAISIGLALLRKGMSIGAVMAFIIGGAGMAVPEISLLLGFFKFRFAALIVGVIFLTAVCGGYIFNIFF
ncbi:MAG: permease [Synergistaceae bacterium]|nr:permease [Synergistaceae bacterium]